MVNLEIGPDPSLLLVDDDEVFLDRLAQAMRKQGFVVNTAQTITDAKAIALAQRPAFGVVDLHLRDGNGLGVLETLLQIRSDSRIVVLTGYGEIATAVAAIKAGATDYMVKPADAMVVASALLADKDALPLPPESPMSADRVRWEHIQWAYELCDFNLSETARRLKMHWRTLQRIMVKGNSGEEMEW